MKLIDSDILTLIARRKPSVLARLAVEPQGEAALPSIVRLEVLRGRIDAVLKADTAGDLLRMQRSLAEAEDLLARFPVMTFDEAAGEHYDRLRAVPSLRKVGHRDLMIAAVALSHAATLVSRNLKDFRLVPGLRVENWAD